MEKTLPKSYLKSFVRVSTVIYACGALVTAIGFYLAFREQGTSYADSRAILDELDRGLTNRALLLFSLTLLLSLTAIIVLAVFYSHRVAGPLHKLGREVRRIASGDLTGSFRLRKNDVLHALADDLGGLSGRYRGHVAKLEIKARELAVVMNDMKMPAPRNGGPGSPQEISKRVEELKGLLDQIKL